jgi:signal transduction histidine kinase
MNLYKYQHAIITLVCFLIPLFGFSQEQFIVRRIDLPSPFLRPVLREAVMDPHGFIYFTTNEGMWRFDGTGVQPLNLNKSELPPTSVPVSIYPYKNYILFDVSDKNQLLIFSTKNSDIHSFPLRNPIITYEEDEGKGLTVYTKAGEILSFDQQLHLKSQLSMAQFTGWNKGNILGKIIHDQDKSYVLANDKLGMLSNRTITWESPLKLKHHGDASMPLNYIRGLSFTSKFIIADYSNGFRIYDKSNLRPLYEYHGRDFAFTVINKDKILVFKKNSPSINPLKSNSMFDVHPQILPDMKVRGVLATGKQNDYLIRSENSLFTCSLQDTSTAVVDDQEHIIDFFKTKSIRSILKQGDNLYIGTYEGFYVCTKSQIKYLTDIVIYCMSPIDNRTLILGMEGGNGFLLMDLITNEIKPFPAAGKGISTTRIVSQPGRFITGAMNQIYEITKDEKQNWKRSTIVNDPRLGYVKDLKIMGNTCWIAADGGLFYLLKNKLTKVFPLEGKLTIQGILPYNDQFWLATNGRGLIRVNKTGRILQEVKFNEGLVGNYVFSVYLEHNVLFTGTNGGLSLLDLREGVRTIDFKLSEQQIPAFTQEFNHSAIFADTVGHQLIMGGLQGLLFLDLNQFEQLKDKPASSVLLSYVKKGGSSSKAPEVDLFAQVRNTINIQPERNYISVKFARNNWQKKVLWRIKEFGHKWSEGSVEEDINMYAMPPGTYTLEARFPSVTDQKYWLSKKIVVQPKFIQTIFFKAIIFLFVIAGIYLLWRLKVARIITEQQLRTAIASDLHDEIGSALTRISMSSELMLMGKHDNAILERISTDSKNAISSISDIIWSVDSRNDTWSDLIMRMREHAYVLLEDTAQLNFTVNDSDEEHHMSQEVRQNLYLIFKEAITNIARHNSSTEVWIEILNTDSKFSFIIKNKVTCLKDSAYTGQGLSNIEMRAHRIKSDLQIINDKEFFKITVQYHK